MKLKKNRRVQIKNRINYFSDSPQDNSIGFGLGIVCIENNFMTREHGF